ncbi:SLATT domain-containing protein [Streptomyces sp. NPDC005402]|uniref:SLATT domain-containing protein n=1 Tax=Streptomyces sp. NPDC005402 TaxID=3155338 RepID=UPI0033B0E21D
MRQPDRNIDPETLISQWKNGLRILHIANHRCASRYQARHQAIGISSVTLSVIVGTSIFATVSQAPIFWISIATGSISVANALLAALQTHLRYPERSEKHLQAAHQYGSLRRHLEEKSSAAKTPSKLVEVLAEIGPKWNEIDHSAPPIPQRVNNKVVREVKQA